MVVDVLATFCKAFAVWKLFLKLLVENICWADFGGYLNVKACQIIFFYLFHFSQSVSERFQTWLRCIKLFFKISKLSKTFKSPSQLAYSKQVSSWPSNRELFSNSPSTSRPQGIHAVVFNLLKGIIFLANLIAVYPISLFLFRRRDEQCGHSLEGICLSGDYEK